MFCLYYLSPQQDKGVLLTTYDTVRNNSKSLQGNCFSEDEETEDGTTWDYMILDEVIISIPVVYFLFLDKNTRSLLITKLSIFFF